MDLVAKMPADLATFTPSVSDPDLGLLLRYRDHGDHAALEALFQRHADVAYRVARRATGNASDAEDVLQEAFIVCMAAAKHFRGTGTVRAWIIGIVSNVQRRQARSQRRRSHHEGQAPAPLPTPPSTDEEISGVAMTCLAELPERYRLPVAMRHLDALEFSDIAVALGSKEKTVRSRVDRGLAQLQGRRTSWRRV